MSRYTKPQFAEKEGISIPVLDSWIYRHGLPHIQIGRRVYIDQAEFDAWWKEHQKIVPTKPVKSFEVAMPVQCRKSSIAHKMRKIY